MEHAGIAEKYALCVFDQVHRRNELAFCDKYMACIVIAGITELMLEGAVGIDETGKLTVTRSLGSDTRLRMIYEKIAGEKQRSLKKWLEYFMLSGGRNRQVADALAESLDVKGFLTRSKYGRLLKLYTYEADREKVGEVIESVRSGMLGEQEPTNETQVLASLLVHSQLSKRYFTVIENERLKRKVDDLALTRASTAITCVRRLLEELDTITVSRRAIASF